MPLKMIRVRHNGNSNSFYCSRVRVASRFNEMKMLSSFNSLEWVMLVHVKVISTWTCSLNLRKYNQCVHFSTTASKYFDSLTPTGQLIMYPRIPSTVPLRASPFQFRYVSVSDLSFSWDILTARAAAACGPVTAAQEATAISSGLKGNWGSSFIKPKDPKMMTTKWIIRDADAKIKLDDGAQPLSMISNRLVDTPMTERSM